MILLHIPIISIPLFISPCRDGHPPSTRPSGWMSSWTCLGVAVKFSSFNGWYLFRLSKLKPLNQKPPRAAPDRCFAYVWAIDRSHVDDPNQIFSSLKSFISHIRILYPSFCKSPLEWKDIHVLTGCVARGNTNIHRFSRILHQWCSQRFTLEARHDIFKWSATWILWKPLSNSTNAKTTPWILAILSTSLHSP